MFLMSDELSSVRPSPLPSPPRASASGQRVGEAALIDAELNQPRGTGQGPAASAVREDLRALRAVVEGTARGTGQEFFQSLVRHLAEAIDVHYAVVAEFPKSPAHVRTLAFWERDRIADNFEYDFTGTPCAEIVRGGFVHYPAGVSRLFPQAAPLVARGIEG